MSERRPLFVEHGHPAKWMSVPEEVFEDDLAEYAKYKRRELAVIKYSNRESYADIEKATKICKREVIRLVKLGMAQSQRSTPRFFALTPRRAKAYGRHEPLSSGGQEEKGELAVERGFTKFFADHTAEADIRDSGVGKSELEGATEASETSGRESESAAAQVDGSATATTKLS